MENVSKDEFLRARRKAGQHADDTANPHNVTKAQVGLGNVTNNAQVKKIAASTDGNLMKWSGSGGDTPADSGIAAFGLKSEYLTLTKSGEQSVSTTNETAVTFDGSVAVGGATLLVRDGNKIKAAVNCYVVVMANVSAYNFSTSRYFKFRIRLNGARYTQGTIHVSSTASTAAGGALVSAPIALSANDYIDISIDSDDSSYTVSESYLTFLTARAWAR